MCVRFRGVDAKKAIIIAELYRIRTLTYFLQSPTDNEVVKSHRGVTNVRSAGLYITISSLRDSARRFPGRDNAARRALIVVFHVRFPVLNYPAYSPSDILALTSGSSLTTLRQLNWPPVGLSFQRQTARSLCFGIATNALPTPDSYAFGELISRARRCAALYREFVVTASVCAACGEAALQEEINYSSVILTSAMQIVHIQLDLRITNFTSQ